MEIGMVRKIDIDNEMQQAYLDYAMSVIVARALPDARDGLKPVPAGSCMPCTIWACDRIPRIRNQPGCWRSIGEVSPSR